MPLEPDIPADLSRFAQEVRIYMRDHPEVNELIDGEESGVRLVLLCMAMAISRYNMRPPLLGMADFATFPSRALLIDGTAIELLKSAQFLLARNSLLYQDGGVTVGDVELRWDKYEKMIQRLLTTWLSEVDRLKVAMNIDSALGSGIPVGVASEYYWLSGAYGGYG